MGDHRKENLNGWYSPLSPVWLSWCRSTETSCREGHAAFQNYEVVGSDNGTHFHVPLMPRWCRGRASSGTGTSGSKRRQWWDEVVVLVDEGEMKSWTRSIRNWHHSATQAENLWPTCRSFKLSVDDVWLTEHVWTRRAGLKEYKCKLAPYRLQMASCTFRYSYSCVKKKRYSYSCSSWQAQCMFPNLAREACISIFLDHRKR